MMRFLQYRPSPSCQYVAQLIRRCAFSTDAQSSNQLLYMWGTNTSGCLFDLPSMVLTPTLIDWRLKLDVQDESTIIQHIVCGPSDTAIVLSDGRCFLCGENKHGQLGLGHKNPVLTPTLLPDIAVRSVSLGPSSSALIDTNGELYTFGYGGSTLTGIGQLGHGDVESVLTPKLVTSMVEDGCYAKQVEVGGNNTCVLTTEGEVLCTGAGSFGRLGNFESTDQIYFEPVELLTSGVDQIAAGKSFFLALKDGVVSGWGKNHKGQLGTGYGMSVDMYAMAEVPTEVASDELNSMRVSKIAAGHSLAACITDDGRLYYWGMSLFLEPEYVNALLHTKVVDVACGDDYWMALGEDGLLYSYGSGKAGVLGTPIPPPTVVMGRELTIPFQAKQRRQNQACLVEALADKRVTQVSAGWKHAAALVVDV